MLNGFHFESHWMIEQCSQRESNYTCVILNFFFFFNSEGWWLCYVWGFGLSLFATLHVVPQNKSVQCDSGIIHIIIFLLL